MGAVLPLSSPAKLLSSEVAETFVVSQGLSLICFCSSASQGKTWLLLGLECVAACTACGACNDSVSVMSFHMALHKISGLEQVTVPRMASFTVLGTGCCVITDTGSVVRCIHTESLLYCLLFPKSYFQMIAAARLHYHSSFE